MKLYIYFSLFMFTMTHPYYFMYPVASLHDGKIILFIKQQTKQHIDLILWNNETHQETSGLWSLFNPAGLQLLPDETGFSFIDNGRLRIKYFNKRSPKTIDFDQYFFNITIVNWINSQECYFSAKMNDWYAIFHCNIDGTTHKLVSEKKAHCIYPQKINDNLFFIKETINKEYSIVWTNYLKNDDKNDIQLKTIINFNNNPIMFLHMISEQEGFVINQDQNKSSDQKNIVFHYYHIFKLSDIWNKKCLFSFEIPSILLLSNSSCRLYESLLPLIPRFIDKKIYFVDSLKNDDNKLELFSYNLENAMIESICTTKKYKKYINFFVPIKSGQKLIFGGEVS